MSEFEQVKDTSHSFSDEEYFDGNDVKTYSAQNGRETFKAEKTPEEIQKEQTLSEPAKDYFDQVYKDALRGPGDNEAYARQKEQEARENYQKGVEWAMASHLEQQAAAERTEMMQDTVESVVARHEAKIDAREDVQEVLETIYDKKPDTDEVMTEAGRQWLAEHTTPLPTPQEQVVLPRPAGEGAASEKAAPKLGMFERRRLEASKSLMNQMANAASELANAPRLSVEEHAKYVEDTKRYRAAAADLVMGVRPALSAGELKGNRGSLEKLENKVLKNKNERGFTLSKDEKKRLSKLK